MWCIPQLTSASYGVDVILVNYVNFFADDVYSTHEEAEFANQGDDNSTIFRFSGTSKSSFCRGLPEISETLQDLRLGCEGDLAGSSNFWLQRRRQVRETHILPCLQHADR